MSENQAICQFCSKKDDSVQVLCESRCLICSRCQTLPVIRRLLIEHTVFPSTSSKTNELESRIGPSLMIIQSPRGMDNSSDSDSVVSNNSSVFSSSIGSYTNSLISKKKSNNNKNFLPSINKNKGKLTKVVNNNSNISKNNGKPPKNKANNSSTNPINSSSSTSNNLTLNISNLSTPLPNSTLPVNQINNQDPNSPNTLSNLSTINNLVINKPTNGTCPLCSGSLCMNILSMIYQFALSFRQQQIEDEKLGKVINKVELIDNTNLISSFLKRFSQTYNDENYMAKTNINTCIDFIIDCFSSYYYNNMKGGTDSIISILFKQLNKKKLTQRNIDIKTKSLLDFLSSNLQLNSNISSSFLSMIMLFNSLIGIPNKDKQKISPAWGHITITIYSLFFSEKALFKSSNYYDIIKYLNVSEFKLKLNKFLSKKNVTKSITLKKMLQILFYLFKIKHSYYCMTPLSTLSVEYETIGPWEGGGTYRLATFLLYVCYLFELQRQQQSMISKDKDCNNNLDSNFSENNSTNLSVQPPSNSNSPLRFNPNKRRNAIDRGNITSENSDNIWLGSMINNNGLIKQFNYYELIKHIDNVISRLWNRPLHPLTQQLQLSISHDENKENLSNIELKIQKERKIFDEFINLLSNSNETSCFTQNQFIENVSEKLPEIFFHKLLSIDIEANAFPLSLNTLYNMNQFSQLSLPLNLFITLIIKTWQAEYETISKALKTRQVTSTRRGAIMAVYNKEKILNNVSVSEKLAIKRLIMWYRKEVKRNPHIDKSSYKFGYLDEEDEIEYEFQSIDWDEVEEILKFQEQPHLFYKNGKKKLFEHYDVKFFDEPDETFIAISPNMSSETNSNNSLSNEENEFDDDDDEGDDDSDNEMDTSNLSPTRKGFIKFSKERKVFHFSIPRSLMNKSRRELHALEIEIRENIIKDMENEKLYHENYLKDSVFNLLRVAENETDLKLNNENNYVSLPVRVIKSGEKANDYFNKVENETSTISNETNSIPNSNESSAKRVTIGIGHLDEIASHVYTELDDPLVSQKHLHDAVSKSTRDTKNELETISPSQSRVRTPNLLNRRAINNENISSEIIARSRPLSAYEKKMITLVDIIDNDDAVLSNSSLTPNVSALLSKENEKFSFSNSPSRNNSTNINSYFNQSAYDNLLEDNNSNDNLLNYLKSLDEKLLIKYKNNLKEFPKELIFGELNDINWARPASRGPNQYVNFEEEVQTNYNRDEENDYDSENMNKNVKTLIKSENGEVITNHLILEDRRIKWPLDSNSSLPVSKEELIQDIYQSLRNESKKKINELKDKIISDSTIKLNSSQNFSISTVKPSTNNNHSTYDKNKYLSPSYSLPSLNNKSSISNLSSSASSSSLDYYKKSGSILLSQPLPSALSDYTRNVASSSINNNINLKFNFNNNTASGSFLGKSIDSFDKNVLLQHIRSSENKDVNILSSSLSVNITGSLFKQDDILDKKHEELMKKYEESLQKNSLDSVNFDEEFQSVNSSIKTIPRVHLIALFKENLHNSSRKNDTINSSDEDLRTFNLNNNLMKSMKPFEMELNMKDYLLTECFINYLSIENCFTSLESYKKVMKLFLLKKFVDNNDRIQLSTSQFYQLNELNFSNNPHLTFSGAFIFSKTILNHVHFFTFYKQNYGRSGSNSRTPTPNISNQLSSLNHDNKNINLPTKFSSLDIKDFCNNFDKYSYDPSLYSIPSSKKDSFIRLKSINLFNMGIGDSGLGLLLNSLLVSGCHHFLEDLNLSTNLITMATNSLPLLSNFISLKNLNLSFNFLTLDSIQQRQFFFYAFKSLKNLEFLSLKNNKIQDFGLRSLAFFILGINEEEFDDESSIGVNSTCLFGSSLDHFSVTSGNDFGNVSKDSITRNFSSDSSSQFDPLNLSIKKRDNLLELSNDSNCEIIQDSHETLSIKVTESMDNDTHEDNEESNKKSLYSSNSLASSKAKLPINYSILYSDSKLINEEKLYISPLPLLSTLELDNCFITDKSLPILKLLLKASPPYRNLLQSYDEWDNIKNPAVNKKNTIGSESSNNLSYITFKSTFLTSTKIDPKIEEAIKPSHLSLNSVTVTGNIFTKPLVESFKEETKVLSSCNIKFYE